MTASVLPRQRVDHVFLLTDIYGRHWHIYCCSITLKTCVCVGKHTKSSF